jgi:putative endonuclease
MGREYHFYVYIITNHLKTVLYIGITDNLIRRIIEHKFGFGSLFTSRYNLRHLVYFEEYRYVRTAIAREKELKGWRRDRKLELIKKDNPLLLDLSQIFFKDSGYSNETIKIFAEEIRSSRNIDPSRGAQDDKRNRVLDDKIIRMRLE